MCRSLSRIRYPSRAMSYLQRFESQSSRVPAPADYLQKRGRDKGPSGRDSSPRRPPSGVHPIDGKIRREDPDAYSNPGGVAMTRLIRCSGPYLVALILALLAGPLLSAVLVSDVDTALAKGPGGGGGGGGGGNGGGGGGTGSSSGPSSSSGHGGASGSSAAPGGATAAGGGAGQGGAA